MDNGLLRRYRVRAGPIIGVRTGLAIPKNTTTPWLTAGGNGVVGLAVTSRGVLPVIRNPDITGRANAYSHIGTAILNAVDPFL